MNKIIWMNVNRIQKNINCLDAIKMDTNRFQMFPVAATVFV